MGVSKTESTEKNMEGEVQEQNRINDGTHLTLQERIIIETGCQNGSTKTAIALTLGKDKSTIGKEIKHHRKETYKFSLPLECTNYRHCKLGRTCTDKCLGYKPFRCNRRDRSPGVCNGCSNWSKCRFGKFTYDAHKADAEYRLTLVDNRVGVDLNTEEAKRMADIIRPLLRQGQSPYMIVKNHPELHICEKTLYNYIEGNVFEFEDIGPLDLRRQVSRKLPKSKAKLYKKREDRSFLKGRTHNDYIAFLKENPNASVVQMDTVYNDVSNGPFIQTFKFVSLKIMFAIYHDTHTAQDMVDGVNLLEKILGRELFDQYVQVLLTDRGGEFVKADDLRRGLTEPDGHGFSIVIPCNPDRKALWKTTTLNFVTFFPRRTI